MISRMGNQQYSLRAILVPLRLVVFWAGWDVQISKHRKAMLKQITADGGLAVASMPLTWKTSHGIEKVRWRSNTYRISWIGQRLGDKYVRAIGFNRRMTAADKEAASAFPEADIYAVP